jgi:hypothetical protein
VKNWQMVVVASSAMDGGSSGKFRTSLLTLLDHDT